MVPTWPPGETARHPALRQVGDVERVPVVLGRNETALRDQVDHRLVLAAVAEGKLVGAGPRGKAEELVAEADAEERLNLHLAGLHRLYGLADVIDRLGRHSGVARAVGEEEAIHILKQRLQWRVPWHERHLAVALEQ
eukprot:scaffold156435_cov24-Tisochrysis_lutea.AAC.4